MFMCRLAVFSALVLM